MVTNKETLIREAITFYLGQNIVKDNLKRSYDDSKTALNLVQFFLRLLKDKGEQLDDVSEADINFLERLAAWILSISIAITAKYESSFSTKAINSVSKAAGLFGIMPMHSKIYNKALSDSLYDQIFTYHYLFQSNLNWYKSNVVKVSNMVYALSKNYPNSSTNDRTEILQLVERIIMINGGWTVNQRDALFSNKLLSKGPVKWCSKPVVGHFVEFGVILIALCNVIVHVIGPSGKYAQEYANNLCLRINSFFSMINSEGMRM